MAEKVGLTFSYHGVDCKHVERLTQITESEFLLLHSFATLLREPKNDFSLENLVGSQICSAVWSCFTPIQEGSKNSGLD